MKRVIVPDLVRDAREAQGLSQAELACKSGVPKHTIGNIEAGKVKDPGYTAVRGLADALGVQDPFFFYRHGEVETLHDAS